MAIKNSSRFTRPLYALLLAVAVGLGAWTLWPRPLPVEVLPVSRGPLTISFTEEGRTRLRERYLVSAPLAGTVERIELEPGDSVTAGATVAHLRPSASALLDPAGRAGTQAQWRAADGALRAAQADVAAAATHRDEVVAQQQRAERLARDQLVSAQFLDEARARAGIADAALRSAQARSHAARMQRDAIGAALAQEGHSSTAEGTRIALPAPVDGRVIRRFVESEGPVAAGAPLLEIGDPSVLEVEVDVLTSEATRIAAGTPVRLEGWGGGALEGRVRAIEPGAFTKVSALGVEEQRVMVLVELAEHRGAAALGDGFRVDARFQVWHDDEVLGVPTAALFRDGPHWAVYAVEGGRAHLRRVRLGHVGVEAAEVLEGLEEGAGVVAWPGDRVRDGLRVRAAPAPRP